ncbi:MAG: nucleotidyltransferase family protein [Bryobacteraceae bacterium]|jgi:predicted nucleotidyltransferase
MITRATVRRERRTEILRLAEAHGGRNLRIFGSVARGDNREDSDVDFLVEFDQGRSLLDLIGLRLDLQDLLGVSVDIVTPKSLRYIRDRIMAEAQIP